MTGKGGAEEEGSRGQGKPRTTPADCRTAMNRKASAAGGSRALLLCFSAVHP